MSYLAIFDVDGTLVDSQDLIAATMAQAHRAAGIAPPPRARMVETVGLSLAEAFRHLHPGLGEAAVAALVAGYHDSFTARGGREAAAPLFPGVAEGLARLAASRDHLLGMATGKGRRGLRATIESHGMQGWFATTQCADDHPSKPHPAMLLAALAETGTPRHAAAMVGDTSFDMAMARTAGVTAIGVAWGYHPPERLRAAGASHVVGDWAELEALLCELAQ